MTDTTFARAVRVTRSRRSTLWVIGVALVLVAVLAYLPYLVFANVTDLFVNFFILLTLGVTWNLLAGYAGLVSVGQQAYLGVGAYTVLVLATSGISPFLAIPLGALAAAIVSIPVSFLVLHLRGAYFAIATWVVAEAFRLAVLRAPSLGGGTGATLPGLAGTDPALREAFTYWAALAVALGAVVGCYLLLRGRFGLDLTAIRDNEIGARSVGVRINQAKRIAYFVAATGAGAAGALVIVSQLNVQAGSIFSVQWSAYMIFVALIGGIGTIEGPIVGTLIFFALQQSLADRGAWYLIVVGCIAVLMAMWIPRGLWGLLSDRFHLKLFPTGYWLHDS
ncbi:MAG TPA: branched-chain amino acid ABC transporter permease [Candidatus Dormibacteraeota bacterium]|nr:branched-chain amino acid ABC transporter permease [Candidatus Dormibacteraeota bacterium]